MNTQLIDSLARIILSLSEEERELLNRKIESEQRENLQINAQILDLENRVKQYENQYRMSSEEFYPRFRSGELGDAMDYFEWNVYYEMLLAARKEIGLRWN
jgi:midasin (ATPase involved in ribosome maturation)